MKTALCPDPHALAALLESETAEGGTEYADHLETCTHCQQTLAELAADESSWQDLPRYLPQTIDMQGWSCCEPALERGIVQFKSDLSLLLRMAETASEEVLSLSFLRAADRPGLLGYLGEYEVLEVIGRGGMGVVFKALDPALHRLVAIKVIAANVAGSPTVRQRFTREAQAAAAVCHDHIVTVHGVFERDGLPYLVMQYVAGESLQTRLDRTGPLELEEIVRIGLQTASGLAAAHAQGLIHRDIKPANLLLENGTDRVKITDFGLARMGDDAQLTQNGAVVGTPEYMAPEQARCEPIDHRADLFSLGSVLYALCTGVAPFRGSPAVAVLRQVSDQLAQPIRELNPDIPAWLEAFIARLMAKAPADRFQSAAEVAALLEGYLAHLRQPETVAAPKLPSFPMDSSRRVRWFRRPRRLVACVLLATLGLCSSLMLLAALLPAQQPLSRTFSQDFRNSREPTDPVRLIGPDANLYTRSENEGFRVTLPAQRTSTDPVGVIVTSPIVGNFEITTGYELMDFAPPKTGGGVGVELYIMTDTPTQEAIGLYRTVHANEGEDFGCIRMTGGGVKRKYLRPPAGPTPATSKTGQLRVTRTGNQVTFWAADGVGGEFRELWRTELNTEDLRMVRMAAYTGKFQEPVDVRILDLTIRASDLAIDQASDSQMLSVTPPDTVGRGWMMVGGIAGLLLTGGIVAGVFLIRRNSRLGSALSPAATLDNKVGSFDAAGSSIVSFSCSTCGKNLKAKAELAGKKVKCTQCGKPVAVPSMKTT